MVTQNHFVILCHCRQDTDRMTIMIVCHCNHSRLYVVLEVPNQFSWGQTVHSLTCSIMDKPHTGFYDYLNMLLSCFRENMSGGRRTRSKYARTFGLSFGLRLHSVRVVSRRRDIEGERKRARGTDPGSVSVPKEINKQATRGTSVTKECLHTDCCL